MKLNESIIATKLHPPRVHFKPMPRKQFSWQTISLIAYKVYAVSAPAGYGKSTLLNQWYEELENQKVNTCWLSLDKNDNDPIRLLKYIASTIEQTNLIQLDALNNQLNANDFTIELLVDCFLSGISKIQQQIVIFFDDFHLLKDSICLTLITQIISQSPEKLSFVLASREYIPVDLTQLKVSESLYQLDRYSLSFTLDEVTEYINQYKQLNLAQSDVELLFKKTEGWAVGLQLIGLILTNVSERHQLLSELSGSGEDVANYLEETVFSNLSEKLQYFLLVVSQFDRFTADLFDHIVGNQQGQDCITQLEKLNLFIIALDRERVWYRFHHLFEDFLRRKSQSVLKTELKNIYLMSAKWFEENYFVLEALNYYFFGNHYDHATKLLSKHCYRIVTLDGNFESYLNWVKQLPEKYLSKWPELRANYAHALLVKFDSHSADMQLTEIGKWLNDCRNGKVALADYPEGHMQLIEMTHEYLRCVIAAFCERIGEYKPLSEQWLKKWSYLPISQTGPIYTALTHGCAFTYEFEKGYEVICKALKGAEQQNSYNGLLWSYLSQGLVFYQQGLLNNAINCYQKAYSYTQFQWSTVNYFQFVAKLHQLAIDWDQGDLQEIYKLAHELNDQSYNIAFVYVLIFLFTILIRYACLKGDYAVARSHIDKGFELAAMHNMPRLKYVIVCEAVQCYLLQHDIDQAIDLAKNIGLMDNSMNDIPVGFEHIIHEYGHLCQIRIAQANSSKEKNVLLSRMIQQVAQQKRIGMLIQLLVLKSVSLYQDKKTSEAKRTLLEAIRHAAPEGIIMPFIYDGLLIKSLVIEVLNDLPSQLVFTKQFDYLARFNSLLGVEGIKVDYAFTKSIEPLSKRELEILRELDSIATNLEIADRLSITNKTLKWHLTNIYGKLDVPNRASAVNRAKQLKMLSR